MRDVGDQQPGQCRDGDVDQEADGHVVGLEVNPGHRTQFEVDEQQQDVIDRDVAFFDHAQKGDDRGPGSDGADGEQCQEVEALHAQIPQRFGLRMHFLPHLFCPFVSHDALPLNLNFYQADDAVCR